jgi:signal transduction histidine kinase/DNA-binding response OmpR family regulator
MTLTFTGILETGWFGVGPLSVYVTVEVLAGLLTLTTILALAALRMLYLERQKRAEADEQFRKQATAAQMLLDAIPFPVMLKDATGAYRMLNDACRLRLGIDTVQAIGQTSLELQGHRLLLMADRPSAMRRIHQLDLEALRDNKVKRCELDYVSSNGRQRVGLFLASPQRAPDGEANGTVSVLLDITEYRELELNARATEQSLQEITQRIPVVIFAVRRGNDRLYRLAFVTGNLHALFGLEQSDLLEAEDVLRDWPFHDRIHAEDAPTLRSLLRHATRHMQPSMLDFRAYGAEGLRWIHMVMVPRRLPDNSGHWIGYFIDTTSLNAHNEALRAARDAAERASKAKADFLATMSHEIRTPMSGVMGMLELLAHTPLDAEQHELLHAAEDSAGVLMQVLNDVLDFSKLEAGNLRLDDAPFDLRTLIDNVVGMMTGPMHKKGLRIEVGMDATLAGQLVGDSVRLRQILLNLLNNASKFTEHGSVAVALRVLGDDGHRQRLQLSVTDTGIGIATDKQANLFTPFSQAESWTTRRYGGTGLGLAICRHLIQLMGGTIELSSRLGEGTKVSLELRLPIAQREVERPAGLAGRHAIVRLSSSSIANALSAHLAALGLTVEQTPASQPMRRGIAANLLFVDLDDRESPGMIAARAVAVDLGSMRSSRTQDGNERMVLNANPLKWQTVSRICRLALEPLHPASRDLRSVSAASPRVDAARRVHGRILVAEDHPISQSLLRRQLDMLGWSCHVVSHGQAAYEALCQADADYVLLMTDCQMPLMNGYELASKWRQYEEQRNRPVRLPIIAMTANALDGEVERCHAAGMDDYLSKPVQLRQLEEKIQLWIPRPAAADDESADIAPAVHDDVFAEPGMQTMRAEMLHMLIQTSHDDLQKLEHAMAISDSKQVIQVLHRLLGALQLFTTDQVIADGRELMNDLAGEHANEAKQQFPAYLGNLRQVLTELTLEADNS